MNNVLITGAPGWLGTRLVEALAGLPEFQKYSKSSKRNLFCFVLKGMDATPLKKLGAKVIEGDLSNIEDVKAAFKDNAIDTVFHLAGLIHSKKTRNLYAVNHIGTKNLVDTATAAGVRRFIYVSSNSTAGHTGGTKTLMKESDHADPYKNYGFSKYLAERAVQTAHEEGKMEAVIIRPFWFYGPGQPERQTEFFKMIRKGNPVIFGNGANLRSMSYVDNTVQGLLLAESVPGAAGQTYFIADERPYSTIEIYSTIADLLGASNLQPRFLPNMTSGCFEFLDDVLQFFGRYHAKIHVAGEMNKNIACSIEKAKRELGYAPEVDLVEGMRRSIAWCAERQLL